MTKLFLRVYLVILVAVVTAGVVAAVGVIRHMRQAVEWHMETLFDAPLDALVDAIETDVRAGVAAEDALTRRASNAEWPKKYADLGALPLADELRERVRRGELVIRISARQPTAYRYVPSVGRAIVLGPLPAYAPELEIRGILGAIIVLLGLFIGVLMIVRPIERQLDELARAATSFGQGNRGVRAAVRSTSAVGDLAGAFNDMANRIGGLIDAEEHLLRMVSHEIRTPLQRLRFSLEMLEDAVDDTERTRRCERMETDLGAIDRLVEELLTYSRLHEGAPAISRAANDARALTAEAIAAIAEPWTSVRFELENGDVAVPIRTDARLFRRAVENLVSNAARHANSRVVVSVKRERCAVTVTVDDDGSGIPAEQRDRVFAPFVRLPSPTEESGRPKGTGVGLAIVRRIAEAHGGMAHVGEAPIGGARFVLEFPDSQAN